MRKFVALSIDKTIAQIYNEVQRYCHFKYSACDTNNEIFLNGEFIMKKILSILLALSIACGSIMLTACGDESKDDDDDKSVSDKERDEDEDDDKDDDESSSKEDKDDKSSKEDKDDDESSKEDGDDESSEEDNSDDSSSESESNTIEEATYAAGETVNFGSVSFVVPDGYTCEVTEDYAELTSDDEYALESINVQSTYADDISEYTKETFDGMYEMIYSEGFTSGDYQVSTLDGFDTIYYTATLTDEDLAMQLVQYCIFFDDESIVATIGYVDEASAAKMDAFLNSFKVL